MAKNIGVLVFFSVLNYDAAADFLKTSRQLTFSCIVAYGSI